MLEKELVNLARIPELLAPAGSWEAFVAAVEAGADAVYLGGKAFSARQYAANFDESLLARAVEYAHLRDVKVHVTLNTLIREDELDAMLKFATEIHNLGVDAVIVQDLGVMRILRRCLPDLPIHASTQMTLHNLEGALLAEEIGCERVILARELSLDEIAEIKKALNVQVEVFVHGALCFAYSGQCLMSSLIGGRSGNRGMCAQPCRMEYEVVTGQGEVVSAELPGAYLISCKDLNGIELLPDLVAIGVDSLKIEGRMKRPEYVATVISIYRKALDSLAQGGELELSDTLREDLAQIFNRGFTTGYFNGNPGSSLITYGKPNNRGLELGMVEEVNTRRQRARIRLARSLRVGDGIEYAGLGGLVVKFMDLGQAAVAEAEPGSSVWVESLPGVQKGTAVFKTSDASLLARAQEYWERGFHRRVGIWMKLSARQGEPLALAAGDLEGAQVEVKSEFIVEQAKKRSTTTAEVRDKLSRLGDTPYQLEHLDVEMDEGVMVPFSELNELRRRAVEALTQMRLERRRREPVKLDAVQERYWALRQEDAAEPAPGMHNGVRVLMPEPDPIQRLHSRKRPLLSVKVGTWDAAEAAWQAGADLVYLGGEILDASARNLLTEEFWSTVEIPADRLLVVNTPRILHDGELDGWQRIVLTAMSRGALGVLTGNLGMLHWAQSQELPIFADYYLNVFNGQTARFLADHGCRQVALSVELNLEQMQDVVDSCSNVPFEAIVHGDLPMMVTEHCILSSVGLGPSESRPGQYYLKDRKDVLHPLETDQSQRCHIFNGAELNLADSARLLYQVGFAAWRVEGQRFAPERIFQLIRGYRAILDACEDGRSISDDIRLVDDESRTKTHGHYFRGVK